MSIKIDEAFIKEYAFSDKKVSNINNSQCIILGFTFSTMSKGWIYKDYVVSEASAELFKLLHGIKGKNQQKKVIEDFKKRIRDE